MVAMTTLSPRRRAARRARIYLRVLVGFSVLLCAAVTELGTAARFDPGIQLGVEACALLVAYLAVSLVIGFQRRR